MTDRSGPEFLDPVADSALDQGKCPDCGSDDLRNGPRGGLSINVACAACGSEFAVAPGPGMTSRISPRGAADRDRLRRVYGIDRLRRVGATPDA